MVFSNVHTEELMSPIHLNVLSGSLTAFAHVLLVSPTVGDVISFAAVAEHNNNNDIVMLEL